MITHGDKNTRMYALKQHGKELHRATKAHDCFSELALRYPTMQLAVAVKLGYKIEPLEVSNATGS